MRISLKIQTIILLFLSFLLFQKESFAQSGGYLGNWCQGPGWMGWGGSGWFGIFHMILFWVVLVALIIFLIRLFVSSRHTDPNSIHHQASAFEVLKKRYARGEIDKEEFESKKKELS